MYKELQETWSELTAKDAAFEIAKVEVRGEKIKAYVNAPSSLRDVWLMSQQFADRDYLVYQDERWTYARAHKEVASIAAWLRSQGIGPGDRVAIAMRNYPEWLLTYWACTSQGIAAVGMNAWWIAPEMAYALKDSNPKLMVCDQERLDRFSEIQDSFSDLTIVGVRTTSEHANVIPFSELTETEAALPDADVQPDDDACIFYTSGTTGNPKGAQLTHRGCVNNLMNLAFSAAVFPTAVARFKNVELPNPEDAPIGSALITTPLFHVTANNCLAHGNTLTGGKLIHMYRWDAGEALRLIEKEKITSVSGVPTMSREILAHPDFEKYDTSTLLTLGGGGAQLQPDLVAKIDKAVATARPNTGFGMTETCGIITSISGDFFVDKPDSCGPAMPNFETKCIDSEGAEVAIGEVGELLVKGAPVIKGYINRVEATAESIIDGWLHTGDVARIDEHGFIFIVDRVKDMVLRGGENIYCAEVESIIYNMPDIAECSVFGVDDDRLGEEVGVAIVLKDGSSSTAADIREFCLKHGAKHKAPRYIWVLDESLPRNANGKFLKRELKKILDPSIAK
ncbi:MAG: long-chain acyl-CoA synthetase [Oceanicoccus sp.]|jgi:long-chain acyl-CoA synthetase